MSECSGSMVADPEVMRFGVRFGPGGIGNATADPSTALRFAQDDNALGFTSGSYSSSVNGSLPDLSARGYASQGSE
jgi:hypothetical protein